MQKKLLSLSLLCLLFGTLTACSNNAANNRAANNSRSSKNANAPVKTGVAPIADNEVAVIEMEEPAFGTIKIELYSNIAPQHVARFKELAKEGYYNGIAFHRINDSVIQAGDSNTKQTGATSDPNQPDSKNGKTVPQPVREGDSGKPNVTAEFSDIPYDTGILGAARLGNDVNSANSQFFIMLKREAAFDRNYTVYGKVIEGMNNVRTISGVPRTGEKPDSPVRIKSVTIQPK